jgi:Putative zinc-finger
MSEEPRGPLARLRQRRAARRLRREQAAAGSGVSASAAAGSPAVAVDIDASTGEAVSGQPAEPVVGEPQQQAVLAYCRELLRQPTADDAASDSLAAFAHVVASRSGDGGEEFGDELLLAITRRMASVSMPDRSSPGDRRLAVAASLLAHSQSSCRETAVLLAGRANGVLEPADELALSNHLADCPDCRGLDAHLERAEARFLTALAASEQATLEAADAELLLAEASAELSDGAATETGPDQPAGPE